MGNICVILKHEGEASQEIFEAETRRGKSKQTDSDEAGRDSKRFEAIQNNMEFERVKPSQASVQLDSLVGIDNSDTGKEGASCPKSEHLGRNKASVSERASSKGLKSSFEAYDSDLMIADEKGSLTDN